MYFTKLFYYQCRSVTNVTSDSNQRDPYLLPQLIIQDVSFIQGPFHLKLLFGNAIYFSTHVFSSRFFQVSPIMIFNGRRSSHQKLLKISLGVLIWLMLHRYNIRTRHLMTPFPCILQWMVLTKITTKMLILVWSYSMNAFATSTLMSPASDENKTSLNIAKTLSCIVCFLIFSLLCFCFHSSFNTFPSKSLISYPTLVDLSQE